MVIQMFGLRDLGYGDLNQSVGPAGTKLQQSGSKSLSSGNKVTAI